MKEIKLTRHLSIRSLIFHFIAPHCSNSLRPLPTYTQSWSCQVNTAISCFKLVHWCLEAIKMLPFECRWESAAVNAAVIGDFIVFS